jgi:hypothetical protein
MAYRSKNEKNKSWRDWLLRHQGELAACRLPELVLKDEEHWWDFLMHGYLDHHEDPSRFSVDALSQTEKQMLYEFLEVELTGEEKKSALVMRQLESELSENC